jgi:uncharacterized protein HemX
MSIYNNIKKYIDNSISRLPDIVDIRLSVIRNKLSDLKTAIENFNPRNKLGGKSKKTKKSKKSKKTKKSKKSKKSKTSKRNKSFSLF